MCSCPELLLALPGYTPTHRAGAIFVSGSYTAAGSSERCSCQLAGYPLCMACKACKNISFFRLCVACLPAAAVLLRAHIFSHTVASCTPLQRHGCAACWVRTYPEHVSRQSNACRISDSRMMRCSVMSVIMAILDMPLCTCLVFSSRDNGCGLRVPTLAS